RRRRPHLSYDLRAVARPPLRPAAFFWAVVPPCRELLRRVPDPGALPPRLEAPGEFAILAARSFDIPFSFSFSYCFSFLTLGRLFGTRAPFRTSVRTGLAAPARRQTGSLRRERKPVAARRSRSACWRARAAGRRSRAGCARGREPRRPRREASDAARREPRFRARGCRRGDPVSP